MQIIKCWPFFLLGVVLPFLNACADRETPAPVQDIGWKKKIPSSAYRAKKGDTLYSIAWRYGYDYKVLAKFNHFRAPYPLMVGDLIKLPNQTQTIKIAKNISPSPKKIAIQVKNLQKEPASKKQRVVNNKLSQEWIKPANGKIIKRYAPLSDSKGVEIAGSIGEPVLASRAGVVAYSGNGLRGYGNLIIIKHNSTFLSAYAMNQRNLVREGEKIKAGFKIAEMGSNSRGQPLLHFEIRRNGKPVDPLRYIQPK